MGYFIKNRGAGLRPFGVSIPQGNSSDRPNVPKTASVRYNQDIGTMEFWNGSEYVSVVTAGNVQLVVDTFTGDASTTTFTMSQTSIGNNQVFVFVGGVYQIGGSSYFLSGTDIIFTNAPPNNAPIAVIHNTGKIA